MGLNYRVQLVTLQNSFANNYKGLVVYSKYSFEKRPTTATIKEEVETVNSSEAF